MAFLERTRTMHGALVGDNVHTFYASPDITAACMVKILTEIYVAIKTGATVTKRSGSIRPRDSMTDKAFQRHLLPQSHFVQTTRHSRQICR